MAAAAIPALAQLGTSIFGGIFGSSAAKKAAAAQKAAAVSAANRVQNTAENVNRGISAAEGTANNLVLGAAGRAGNLAIDAAGAGKSDVRGAYEEANAYLEPWITAGGNATVSLGNMLGQGGELNRSFTPADMEANDPGYQFRLDQANKAASRALAARGINGGGVVKATSDLNQNLAASEYGAAFARFQQANAQKFSQLSQLAGMGLSASDRAGGNIMQGTEFGANLGMSGAQYAGDTGMQGAEWAGGNAMQSNEAQANNFTRAAEYAGNAEMGGANADAAGTIGAANAWSGALSGVGRAANTWATLSTLGGNPYGGPTMNNPRVDSSAILGPNDWVTLLSGGKA